MGDLLLRRAHLQLSCISCIGSAASAKSSRRQFFTQQIYTGCVLRSILTDSHFWVPLLALAVGVALLLHLA